MHAPAEKQGERQMMSAIYNISPHVTPIISTVFIVSVRLHRLISYRHSYHFLLLLLRAISALGALKPTLGASRALLAIVFVHRDCITEGKYRLERVSSKILFGFE